MLLLCFGTQFFDQSHCGVPARRLCFIVFSIRISKRSSGANRTPPNASSFKASMSSPFLTAVISNQGRRFSLMNQYELTETLPSANLSSASSYPPSFHICECYLTRLICQPPSPKPTLSVCLPQPPDPSLLLFCHCQESGGDCCVC